LSAARAGSAKTVKSANTRKIPKLCIIFDRFTFFIAYSFHLWFVLHYQAVEKTCAVARHRLFAGLIKTPLIGGLLTKVNDFLW
jgi:hypothetical protein